MKKFKQIFSTANQKEVSRQDKKRKSQGSNLQESCLLNEQWRRLERTGSWTENYAEKLSNDIKEHELKEKDIPNVRILLLGQIGAGKSSFLNTVASIDIGRISQITVAGGGDKSVTAALKEYRPREKLKNFEILDTMGLEDQDGLNIQDVLHLVEGHVRGKYMFNPNSKIDEKSSEFRTNPESKDRVHCVVFVIDANIVGQDNISEGTRRNVKALQHQLRALEIPRILLLTKIDILCELVGKDVENTYRSAKIKEAVQIAQQLYQIQEQNIFPVQNYQGEMEMDDKKNILQLLALRQMVYFGTDFLNAVSTSTTDEEGQDEEA